MAFAPTAHSVRVARRCAAAFVEDGDATVRDTVVLLVSELVTNAVLHGGPHGAAATVDLHLETLPDRIRVEVADTGSGTPVVGDGAVDQPSGRGLLLVQRLATRWGCERSAVGKTVWFELLRPGGDGDA